MGWMDGWDLDGWDLDRFKDDGCRGGQLNADAQCGSTLQKCGADALQFLGRGHTTTNFFFARVCKTVYTINHLQPVGARR